MSYLDDYREASWRGEKFWVDTTTASIGRKTALHELPGDVDIVEDIGRLGRRVAVEAHVSGANYAAARDRLRDAVEMPGPGVLVHPYWGELTGAIVGDVTVKESTKHGGLVVFSFTFLEQGDLLLVAVDKALAQKAAAVVGLANKKLKKDFDLAGFVAALIAKVLGKVSQILGYVAKAKSFVDQALGIIDAAASIIVAAVDTLKMIASLPETIAQSIYGAWQSVVASVSSLQPDDPIAQDAAIAALREILSLAWEATETIVDAPITTPTRLRQRVIEQSLRTHSRAVVVALVAESLEMIALPSASSASALQRDLLERIDSLVEEPDIDLELYHALEDLRASVVIYLERTALNLPDIVDYSPAITIPALVAAYDIYGDASRAADIVARNRQLRENELIGGVVLEVLDG
jgi:prophage DNA circulation protein